MLFPCPSENYQHWMYRTFLISVEDVAQEQERDGIRIILRMKDAKIPNETSAPISRTWATNEIEDTKN